MSPDNFCDWIFSEKINSSGSGDAYLPDLTPCDFFLFPKLEFSLKDWHFQNMEGIQSVVTEQLNNISHQDLQNCFKEKEVHLHLCIAASSVVQKGYTPYTPYTLRKFQDNLGCT